MAGKFPESYADPLYASLDAANESKLKLPVGMLSSIRTAGERTNASQVSSAGATTPYQFIPATRKAILDKYGIDVALSPENASEGAGLLLQESLKRSNGDPERAVREYHGGTDPKNWGPVNNAYAKRVMASQNGAKMNALSSGFAKFMADNPATPAATPAPAAAAPQSDPLAAGFGAWLESGAPTTVAGTIPKTQGLPEAFQGDATPTESAPQSLGDKLVGAGETALSVATGATGGTAGMIGGTIKGLAGAVMDGKFGTQEGVRQVEQSAAEGMQALTFAPRTESGQEQIGAVGEAMMATIPVMGLTAELGAAGRAASNAGRAARDAAAVPVQRIRAAAPAIADRVERILRRNPVPDAPATPTPGTRGSAGAAGTDAANQRSALANDLPVPIELTEGQATRSPDQLRFEIETSKGDKGAPLRERYAEQNERIQKNFDAWVDQTGAEAPDLRAVGKTVTEAMVKKAKRDKAEINVAYKRAEMAGELEQPVTLSGLVDHLNEAAPDAVTAPILTVARSRAVQLGIAAETDGGGLVALPTSLKNAERMRQAIGRATDYEPTNIRQSAIIKGQIDAQTDTFGGNLYKSARRMRENYAKQYEDHAAVSSLMNRKKGTADRKVALEDVFESAILKGSRDDLSAVRRVLHTGGVDGQQAWKELQGATVNWLKDEATKNVATDQRGNRIVSAAQLDRALKRLDHDGKLDFVFGKRGAQQMRDINDLAKVVMTAPPGAGINTSNTASVLMAALAEAGVTGSMIGLPVPVISGMRLIAQHSKDKKLRARIEHSLHAPQRRRGTPPAI